MKMLFIAEVFLWLNHLCFAVMAGSKMGPYLWPPPTPHLPWVQNQWQFSFILFKRKTDISVGNGEEDYGFWEEKRRGMPRVA